MRGAVRDVLRAFVAASDDDYRLRCAPERYRMRVSRDFARDVNDLTVAGAKVDFGNIPGFLDGIAEALKVIIEVGARLHGICRWYPPTTAGRSRRRRWLQGCEEIHQAQRQCLLGAARRMERPPPRRLTARALTSRTKPATSPRGGLFTFGRATTRPRAGTRHRPSCPALLQPLPRNGPACSSVASSLKYTGLSPSLQQVMTLPGSFIHPPP